MRKLFSDEFRNLVGEPIPYRRLGFSNLRAFLRTIEGLRITWNEFGEQTLMINDSKISHLNKLICKQKIDYTKTKVRLLILHKIFDSVVHTDAHTDVDTYIRKIHDNRDILFQNKYYKQFMRCKNNSDYNNECKRSNRTQFNNNCNIRRMQNFNQRRKSNFNNGNVFSIPLFSRVH